MPNYYFEIIQKGKDFNYHEEEKLHYHPYFHITCHFKLTKNNYHADIVIVPVEFASGQASRVDNYQYQQDPAIIHRSLIEFSYPVANQQGLQNEVLQDMEQAINY